MSHHGDPAEEEEVIVVEEPEKPRGSEPRVIRAPRVPTQEERETPMRPRTYHMKSGAKFAWRPGAAIRPIERRRRPQGRRPTLIALVHLRGKANP